MSRRKPAVNLQTLNVLDSFNFYVPGVGGMFVLLAWLLAGALLGNIISLPLVMYLGSEAGTEYAMLVSYPIMFVPAIIYAKSKSANASFNRSGLKLDSNRFSPVGGALCALLVMVATLAATFWSDLMVSALPEMPESLKNILEGMTTGTIWVNFLCVSIFAPIFEEWLCRGMVLRGLLGNGIKPVWAVIISALFFAAIHMNPWQALPAFALGCLFGFVYYRTGSLKLTMLMHFTNNTFALVLSNIDSLKDAEGWLDILPKTTFAALLAAAALVIILVIKQFLRIKPESEEIGNIEEVPSIFEQ